jgi:hypothetical protein
MIWHHIASADCPLEEELKATFCIFCGGQMDALIDTTRIGPPTTELRCCRDCGWWSYWTQTGTSLLGVGPHRQPGWSLYGAIAELKAFDITDVTSPLAEVKRYLIAKYESRFDLHPRLFEETVASVFGAMGYSAEATAYSRDGGVDVVLRHADGTTTGVQVKRSRNAVEWSRSDRWPGPSCTAATWLAFS